LTQQVRYY